MPPHEIVEKEKKLPQSAFGYRSINFMHLTDFNISQMLLELYLMGIYNCVSTILTFCTKCNETNWTNWGKVESEKSSGYQNSKDWSKILFKTGGKLDVLQGNILIYT